MSHEKTSRKRWATAPTWRPASAKTSSKAGTEALDKCLAMLKADAAPPPADPEPCEHDYQPSTVFAATLQCSKCHDLRDDPDATPKPKSDQAPLESYEGLMP